MVLFNLIAEINNFRSLLTVYKGIHFVIRSTMFSLDGLGVGGSNQPINKILNDYIGMSIFINKTRT